MWRAERSRTREVVLRFARGHVAYELGLLGLHIHDMRHTVGMRLREAGVRSVREETIADILWYTRQGMTAHYSVVQIEELVGALDRITDECSRINRSLDMIRRERFGEKSPQKAPTERKTG